MNAPFDLVAAEQRDRRTYIGGADIASILGLQPKNWRTSLGTWERKVGDAPPEADKAKRKLYARGHVVEPLVANLLEALHGIKADVRNRRHADPDVPYFAAEIDAEIPYSAVRNLFGAEYEPVPDDEIVNVEIKTVHPFAAHEWGEEGSEDVPTHYAAQVYWGLGVTRRRFAICAALFGADDLVLYPIVGDGETIAGMRDKAEAWWQSYVIPGVPPPPATMGDLAHLYGKDDGSVAEGTETIRGACLALAAMKDARKSYENGEDGVQFLIREHMKSATSLTFDGIELATLKTQSQKFVDDRKLKAEYPEAYKACLSSRSFRVLRLKD